MIPFKNATEAIAFWRQHRTAMSVLIDFTDIGKGVQRREVMQERNGDWILGFSRERA